MDRRTSYRSVADRHNRDCSLDEEKFSKALKENGELVYKATTAGLEKIKKEQKKYNLIQKQYVVENNLLREKNH